MRKGDRVQLSEKGRRWLWTLQRRYPDRMGTVVGFSRCDTYVRVRWNGNAISSVNTLSRSFVEEVHWTTLDGRRIPLSGLTNRHLRNIVRHVREHERLYPPETFKLIHGEAERREIDWRITERSAYEPWTVDEYGDRFPARSAL